MKIIVFITSVLMRARPTEGDNPTEQGTRKVVTASQLVWEDWNTSGIFCPWRDAKHRRYLVRRSQPHGIHGQPTKQIRAGMRMDGWDVVDISYGAFISEAESF